MDKTAAFPKKNGFVRKLCIALLFLITSPNGFSQQVIPLYKDAAPGSENWNWNEQEFIAGAPMNARILYNVSKPSLVVFRPAKPNGCAVIVSPGGGMRVLNYETEGTRIADSLTKYGITVFIFKYRTLRSTSDNPWQETLKAVRSPDSNSRAQTKGLGEMARTDLHLAVKKVRSMATQFNIDTSRVGLMGFSAGAAISSSFAYDPPAHGRPDFVAPIYGVIKLNSPRPVKPNAPPIFIAAASDDSLAKVVNSIEMYKDWMNAKIPVEMHIYAKGGHGLRGPQAADWISRFVAWLKLMGLFERKK